MSIWILALLLLAILTLAGWRQGGIMAAFYFVGIVFGALLATLVGKLFHLILPHIGMSDPITVWAVAPLCGFILVSVIFGLVGFKVHRQVDVYYKHKTSDLRQALWLRLNTRLGICLGVLNGAVYFVLISFIIFNLSYFTTQAAAAPDQSFLVRTVNKMGWDLQSTGMACAAAGVGTLPANFYKFSDLIGFLFQNPKTYSRMNDYPGFTSMWQRDDLQGVYTTFTNGIVGQTPMNQILKEDSVQNLLKNKDLSAQVENTFVTNMDDLMTYLTTGKSAKYTDKIIGQWKPNIRVTIAWFAQNHPKVQSTELGALRALWARAYAKTTILATGDNQLFIKNWPAFKLEQQPGKPATMNFTPHDWKGDWSVDGNDYTLHTILDGNDKFMDAKAKDLRLSVKNGKNLLIFDRAD